MVEISPKDGIQIQAFHTQLRQIRDSVDDTAQIAAQIILSRRFGTPVVHIGLGRTAPGKALRKNLIVYAALHPCRYGADIRLVELQQLEAARLLHLRKKPPVIEPSSVSSLILQPEAVFDVVRLLGKDGFARPLLVPAIA